MKRKIRVLALGLILLLLFSGCKPCECPCCEDEAVDLTGAEAVAEQWRVLELAFQSEKEYEVRTGEPMAAGLDVRFVHRDTGETLLLPTFWDGESVFRVRFAGTKTGLWDYCTVCPGDESLDGIVGTVGVAAYTGDKEIYRHGFVKTSPGKKYFVYDDGTPFFYLGDTHWTMYKEEFDSAGDYADETDADSHFKAIVDLRAAQGYTVYQSEPLGAPFSLTDGLIGNNDLSGFREADRYYQYLAEQGLVHANAEFFFTTALSDKLAKDDNALELLSRYWVARFGAYPVMWTLAQECDNFETDGKALWDYDENNPWIRIASYIHQYDAYRHPLTGHQMHCSIVTAETGQGTKWGTGRASGGKSLFAIPGVTERTGHDWYGVQFSQDLTQEIDWRLRKEYWASPKVSVVYESNYCGLWTDDTGARGNLYAAYLTGMFGYGYGAQDIWYYQSTYDMDEDTVKRDGRSTVTKEDKKVHWPVSMNFPSGAQCGYGASFFKQFAWWRLVPELEAGSVFIVERSDVRCVCAHDGNSEYVVYFYNAKTKTGTLRGLEEGAEYELTWFDPKTGETVSAQTVTANTTVEGEPAYRIGERPREDELVVRLHKKG